MTRRRLTFALVVALSLCLPEAARAATATGAVISNGTVQLGVNAAGQLNYACAAAGDTGCPEFSLSNAREVGLRFVPLNADGTAPGCDCEGWGVADFASKLTGWANASQGSGTRNVVVDSFIADATTAVSTVTVADATVPGFQMRVTHDYRPSPRTPNAYQAVVAITNTGTNPIADLRYRRQMDWDVEPTAFDEWVTIAGSTPHLLFSSDAGPGTSTDPLAGPAYHESQAVCGEDYTGPCTFTDLGNNGVYPDVTQPADHGALFDFGFGALGVGETKRFIIFYGAAPNEAEAVAAMTGLGAEVYSLGESSCPGDIEFPPDGGDKTDCATEAPNSGVEKGTPVTFMFGFVTSSADLAISKTDAPDPVVVGNTVTYTIKVGNNGPDQASGVQVTDTLPAGLQLVSATASQGACGGTTTLTCNVGTLAVGATATITVVGTATAAGPLTNTATVSAASADPNTANDSASTTTTVNAVPPPPPPPPAPAGSVLPAESPLLACTTKNLVLIDVLQSGNRVTLLGAADPKLIGRTVDLIFTSTKQKVASTVVKPDGSFQTTAPLPPRNIRSTSRARYQAVIGAERSDQLKLVRRMLVTSLSSAAGKVTIQGRITQPLGRPLQKVIVSERIGCTKTKDVKTFTPSRSGAYRVTIAAPAGVRAVVYVLRTKVRGTARNRKLFLTKTLPRPVVIRR